MAKKVYKIPAPLDDNYLNMEIAIQNKDGVGLKPLPVRVILVWLASILALFFLETNGGGILAHGGLFLQILFAVTWLGFTWVMTLTDKSHKMQMEWIPALMIYLNKASRTVMTRRTSNANPFYHIVGIESIDEDTGLVHYVDKTFGYWYSVVGTASVLLFPEDRDAILDRVQAFYEKIGTDCEITFMTTKEAQKVNKQLAHLMAQYKILEFRDPDVDTLVREQYNALASHVGREFKSIHQYMVLKGDSREALSVLNTIVMGEYEASSLMFKQCTPLYKSDIEEVLYRIYGTGV